ncbi:Hypothetical protein FKW44_009859, partial [Caligus rogercresseyi]
ITITLSLNLHRSFIILLSPKPCQSPLMKAPFHVRGRGFHTGDGGFFQVIELCRS